VRTEWKEPKKAVPRGQRMVVPQAVKTDPDSAEKMAAWWGLRWAMWWGWKASALAVWTAVHSVELPADDWEWKLAFDKVAVMAKKMGNSRAVLMEQTAAEMREWKRVER
jgi:hypothetical protein